MRWHVHALALLIAACGGKRAPSEQPITNTVPPPAPSQICEDTIIQYPPRIEMGLVISEGTLIERAIREHTPLLRNCYAQRLRYKPHLAGRVDIAITVGADGKATHIHTKGFDAELDRCLCEKLAAIQFETLSGGEVKASYPLYFTPPAM